MVDENIFMLVDDEGNEAEYEFISHIAYKGGDFAVFLPTAEEELDVMILSMEVDEKGNEFLGSVDDEELLEELFEIFKSQEKDRFNFIEE